jgi:eukaryotic-like serine/threonine-protein kinase
VQDIQITLPLGTVLQGRYEVTDLLGRGGFGAVYLVKDQRVRGNLFAIKELIDPDQKERTRFTFEGEVLKRLDHPSLPRVYRVFEDASNNRAYILMDYIGGLNLEILRQQQKSKRFPLVYVMRVMAPIVAAVSYLHDQQPPIIHRDVKPANIIVPTDGEETVLVDFGIAKEYDKDATTTAVRRCSPGYGAPEQYARGTNPGTDVYGLAATFYALLTGIIPADALHRMTHLSSKHIDPLEPIEQLVPDIPHHVSDAIQHALAVDSKDRFASVEEFWQALNTQSSQPVSNASAVPQVSTAQPLEGMATVIVPVRGISARTKKRTAVALLFLSLALFALVIGIAFSNHLLFSIRLPGTLLPAATPDPAVHHAAITPSQPRATATSTAAGTTYPALMGMYHGSLTNQSMNPPVTASMTLSTVKQSGAKISGFLAVGSELSGNGNFAGNVTQDKKVQFLVAADNNNLPLFFSGTINTDGSMSGQYCSYKNGQCDANGGGHGIWNISPDAPASSSSLRPASFLDRHYI